MTMKDGIKFGIGFTIGRILVNDLANTVVNAANVVYPKLYREMKKTKTKDHSETKAKIEF